MLYKSPAAKKSLFYDLCNPATKKGFSVNINTKQDPSVGQKKINNTPRKNIFRVMCWKKLELFFVNCSHCSHFVL